MTDTLTMKQRTEAEANAALYDFLRAIFVSWMATQRGWSEEECIALLEGLYRNGQAA